ncbi:hypothetical protein [Rossellomorea aquimaris]|uniref:hypothetical protein n=1 Tax=Rossellomorea aquimaris TaxID=189382 RepID=UPI0007D07647|nr:hypothetical protein [Rossellomorea aquimaris]
MGRRMHPTIKSCIQHLKELDIDKRTRQIVYMYMKSLEAKKEEKGYALHPSIQKCMQHLKILGSDELTKQVVFHYMRVLQEESDTKKSWIESIN